MTLDLTPLRTKVSADTAPFVGGIRSAVTALGGFQGALGAAGVAVAGFAGAKGIGAAVSSFAEFDEKMTESQAIMDDLSNSTMAEMQQKALDVSRTTVKSADEAAESYFFLASAGLDAEQSIEALDEVAQFAQAGMFDMATATELATDAQSALGLKSQDAAENVRGLVRTTDTLVAANQQANATVEQFSEALTNKLGPRLRILNKDIEEGTAGLAALADQGIKGRRAGRGLSIVFRDLAREAVSSEEAFQRLGIQVFDAEGNMRNLADIVADFERELGGMSDQARTAELQTLGINRRAIGFLNTLIGMSEEIREYEKNLRSAGGATEEVAEKQLKTLNRQLGLLASEAEAAKIQIGGMIAPSIEKDARNLRTIVRIVREEIEDLSEEAGEGEDALGGFGTALIEAIPGATSLETARNALESMADDMERLADEAERVPIEKFGPGAIPGGGPAPVVQGPPHPGGQPPFAPGQEPEKLSAEERERQQQRRTAAEIQRQLQQARNRSLEEEIGLHSRVLQREREKLRMMIREGDEAEKIRKQAERVAELQAKMRSPIDVEAVRPGGRFGRGRRFPLRGTEKGGRFAPNLPGEGGEEGGAEQVPEPEGADIEGLVDEAGGLNLELEDMQTVMQTMAPAIATLTNNARSAETKILTLASSILQMISQLQSASSGAGGAGALPGPLGIAGSVLGTFAGLFQTGGRIPAGQVGLVHEGEALVRGPATAVPGRETVREREVIRETGGGGASARMDPNELDELGQLGLKLLAESPTFQAMGSVLVDDAARRRGGSGGRGA